MDYTHYAKAMQIKTIDFMEIIYFNEIKKIQIPQELCRSNLTETAVVKGGGRQACRFDLRSPHITSLNGIHNAVHA